MIIAKGFEFTLKSRYSRCEKCPFQEEVPSFRALRAVCVQGGVGAGEAQVWLLWEGGSPSPVPLAIIITSPGGVRPESSRAPHDLPLILQRVRQVRTEDGQDPGPRRLVPSRTSLEVAAPVGLDYNPIDCRGSGCRRSAQLARRNTRLARRPKSNVSANRRARPQLRSGIRQVSLSFTN